MAQPDWMSRIPNNGLLLNEITLPSSHDAGVSSGAYIQKGLCKKVWAVCQSQSIAGQLNSGARFFDIRFALNSGVATTVHETAGSGGWGETAQQIFASVKTFLDTNQEEFVILRVSHTDAKTGAAVWRAQDQHLTSQRYYLTGTKKNLATQPIRNFRGKAIVAYAEDAIPNPNPLKGQIRFGKASETSREGLVTCGVYKMTSDMTEINFNALAGVNKHRAINGCALDHLSMVYWQRTYTPGDIQAGTLHGANGVALPVNPTALNTTHGTHYNLPFLLKWLSGGVNGSVTKKKKTEIYPPNQNARHIWVPNVINMDFVNDQSCDAIIAFNEQNLRDANEWRNVV